MVVEIEMTPQEVEDAVCGLNPKFVSAFELHMFRWSRDEMKQCFILNGADGETYMAHSVVTMVGTLLQGKYSRKFFPNVALVEFRNNNWYAKRSES